MDEVEALEAGYVAAIVRPCTKMPMPLSSFAPCPIT